MVQQAASTAARRSARRERSFRRRSCYECSAPFPPPPSAALHTSPAGTEQALHAQIAREGLAGHADIIAREGLRQVTEERRVLHLTTTATHDTQHAKGNRDVAVTTTKLLFTAKQLDPPKRQPTQPKLPHETEITVTSMVSYTWRYDHQTKVTPSDRTAHSFLLGQITRGYSSYVEIVFAGVGTRQSVNT